MSSEERLEAARDAGGAYRRSSGELGMEWNVRKREEREGRS